MSDELKVSADRESNEARHTEDGMQIGLSAPKVKRTPFEVGSKSLDFWSNYGPSAQPGNQRETASNS
jgi:hypothetical protein